MIRKIRPEDYAAVAAFWREYLDVPAASDESVSRTFEKMSEDDRYCTFVAEEDGLVVGFITMVEVLSIDDPDGYIKMNGIAVRPEYRHRGIAQQLTERVELEARERGASSVGVATSFKRSGSQALLDKLGYTKSAFWFHKIF
ncbi:MAG: GNAT family N-acetyltransferase [Oscillospiraceae bacterium]|nr:GNAT family N-acetyltransferase [Oscillospiraceae bacterium]